MIRITQVDKTGEILREDLRGARFRPLNGFTRQKDGSFLKQFGDPRCISDQIKEKLRLEELARVQQQQSMRGNMGSSSWGARGTTKWHNHTFHGRAEKTVSWNEFKGAFDDYALRIFDNDVTVMLGAKRVGKIHMWCLNTEPFFAKIQITEDTVRFWKDEPEKVNPDYTIYEMIEVTP